MWRDLPPFFNLHIISLEMKKIILFSEVKNFVPESEGSNTDLHFYSSLISSSSTM